jgi:NitT/TauT family transport system substrate-binding protein
MDKKNMGKSYLKKRYAIGYLAGIFSFLLFLLSLNATLLNAADNGEDIVYRLKWLKNVSTIGDLYAGETGGFKAAGLSVTIKDGGPERDAIKELELGYARFGVASADQVIRAVAKGAPVVVIAQIFQINPLQWIYHEEEPPIDQIKALRGKTIGITFGGNDETIMRTLLAAAGLLEKEVRFFSVRHDYTPFYNRSVALWPVYRNAQGIILSEKLKAAGKGVRFLDPNQFGIRFVANSVVTSTHLLKSHPDMVRRFVSALLEGWEEALTPLHQEKALQLIRPFDRNTPIEILEKQLAVTRTMVHPDPSIPIGTIDEAAWRQTEQIMRDQGQIPRRIDVLEILRPVDLPTGAVNVSMRMGNPLRKPPPRPQRSPGSGHFAWKNKAPGRPYE